MAAVEYAIVVGVLGDPISVGGVVVWPNLTDCMNEMGADGYRFSTLLWRGLTERPENTNGLPVYEVLMERAHAEGSD
jgi:hypothetical protein